MARRKILVSLDERLLERIDRAARAQAVSRSACLAELVARALEPVDTATRRRAQKARRQLAELGANYGTPGGDSTAFIRRMRDERAQRISG